MAFTNRLKSLKIAGFFNFVSKNSYASSSSASTNKGVEFGIMFDIDGVNLFWNQVSNYSNFSVFIP